MARIYAVPVKNAPPAVVNSRRLIGFADQQLLKMAARLAIL